MEGEAACGAKDRERASANHSGGVPLDLAANRLDERRLLLLGGGARAGYMGG